MTSYEQHRKRGADKMIRPKNAGEKIELAKSGFISATLGDPTTMSLVAIWWNEFLGSLVYGLVARLFVAFFGGSSVAATLPTILGAAFTNGFAFFGAMATFGAISGGHFNPAITLAVLLIEIGVRMGLFGEWEKGTQLWRGRSLWGLAGYFVVQFAGFILAALLIWGFLPAGARNTPIELGIPFVTNVVSNGKTFGTEIAGSFLFIIGYLILLKMFSYRDWASQMNRSLAFGFWYFVLFLVFAPWAGAVWNPSLWLAFAIISGRYTDWWILMWPAVISGIAGALFCLMHWWISYPVEELRKKARKMMRRK